jgi:hypothetical protein
LRRLFEPELYSLVQVLDCTAFTIRAGIGLGSRSGQVRSGHFDESETKNGSHRSCRWSEPSNQIQSNTVHGIRVLGQIYRGASFSLVQDPTVLHCIALHYRLHLSVILLPQSFGRQHDQSILCVGQRQWKSPSGLLPRTACERASIYSLFPNGKLSTILFV